MAAWFQFINYVHIFLSESLNCSHSFLYNQKPVFVVVLLSNLVVLLTSSQNSIA
jgi:hypothetical protein